MCILMHIKLGICWGLGRKVFKVCSHLVKRHITSNKATQAVNNRRQGHCPRCIATPINLWACTTEVKCGSPLFDKKNKQTNTNFYEIPD